MTDKSKATSNTADKGAGSAHEIILRETDSTALDTQFHDIYTTRAAYQQTIADKKSAYVSILVLAYNNLQKHTKYCIESILRHTDNIDYELVLVDNGSSDGTLEYFKSVPHQRTKIVRITNNKGANYGIYIGMQYTEGRYIVLVANDVYVTRNWLSNMLTCAESDKRIGFVAPASDNVSNLQSVNMPFTSFEEMQAKAAVYNNSDPRKWEERLRLMPAVGLYKKECLDIIGGLDYSFQHDFSDDDISIRIRRAGYRLVFCGDVFVHHSGPSVTGTSSVEKIELLKAGRETFRRKYFGIDPWDDVNNFELLMLSLVSPEEKRNTPQPEVLGIDVRCGTPILQLKNRLRLADIFDTNLSAFVEDAKYWLDLKTMCEGTVAVDRIEHVTEHFSPNRFDYILLGKPINSYKGTEKILSDLLSLLKVDGQLLIKIRNDFDVKAFLGSSGTNSGAGKDATVSYHDITRLNKLLMSNGFSIKHIELAPHNFDDATRNAIRDILRLSDDCRQDVDAALNELATAEYALKITANTVHQVDTPAGKPLTAQGNTSHTGGPAPADEGALLPDFKRKTTEAGLTSIIILTHNHLDHTKMCVDSIARNTRSPHEMIFVDNNSTDGTVKWLKKLARENPHYRFISNKENPSFARGCNQGIRSASGEYIVLLNNDVIVTKDWLSGMLECLNSSPGSGIVGPMTNNTSGPQQVVATAYTSLKDLPEYAASFRLRNRYRRIPCRRIAGFCMLFRQSLIENIGLLDESLGTGNFEDDDLCLRASLEGYRNMVAGDVFIHHFGSRGFVGNKIHYGTAITTNMKILSEKWGNIGAYTPLGKKVAVLSSFERAEESFQRQEIDDAVAALIEGIKYLPDHSDIYFKLAEILVDSERFPEALEALDSAPDSARHDTRWNVLNGYCKEGMGLHAEAVKHADDALGSDPASAQALNLRGRLADKDGEYEIAAGYYEKAIECDPGYGISYTNLGVLRCIAEDKHEALALLEKGFILAPTAPDCVSLYHTVACAIGEFERAETVFREAGEFYPFNKKLRFLLIDLLIRQGKNNAAMEEIEKSMSAFAIDDGIISAALHMREIVGASAVDVPKKPGTLSVCMIVKNEEEHIVRCLMSLKPVADEIIVVDTGSTDRTTDIARALGARTFEFSWTDDFSKARNFSLEQAQGGWILIHDADEVLSSLDHGKLRKIVETRQPQIVAYQLTTRNYITEPATAGWTANDGVYPEEEAGTGWYPSPKVRLIVNNNRFRFRNPVHEVLEPSIREANVAIGSCDIPIHHYGKLPSDRNTAKAETYYRLGIKKLETADNVPMALRELAIQASEMKKYEEALEYWDKFIKVSPRSALPFFNMATMYIELGRFQEALDHAAMAREIDPASKEASLSYATASLCIGNPENAVVELEELLGRVAAYPPAQVCLAAAYCMTKNEEKGRGLMEGLLKKGYNFYPALHSVLSKMISFGKTEYARCLLEEMAAIMPDDNDTAALLDKCTAPDKHATDHDGRMPDMT